MGERKHCRLTIASAKIKSFKKNQNFKVDLYKKDLH
jgi:hypothetical protein